MVLSSLWGHADYGGDSSSVRNRLKRVQQVQAGFNSFAAILDDGSVVTWGNPILGGDSSAVQDQLYNVTHIQVVDLLMQITQGIMGLSYEGYSGSYNLELLITPQFQKKQVTILLALFSKSPPCTPREVLYRSLNKYNTIP